MTGEFAMAVHALVYLNHKQTTLSSEELAENICTNPARVRKVMALLKKNGLVSTREGGAGGYTFLLDPASVTLKRVSDAVHARFVSATWRSGDSDMKCLVASGMAHIMDGIYGELDALCRARLNNMTIQDIDRIIFAGDAANPTENPLAHVANPHLCFKRNNS